MKKKRETLYYCQWALSNRFNRQTHCHISFVCALSPQIYVYFVMWVLSLSLSELSIITPNCESQKTFNWLECVFFFSSCSLQVTCVCVFFSVQFFFLHSKNPGETKRESIYWFAVVDVMAFLFHHSFTHVVQREIVHQEKGKCTISECIYMIFSEKQKATEKEITTKSQAYNTHDDTNSEWSRCDHFGGAR